jgi:hypothetical protein
MKPFALHSTSPRIAHRPRFLTSFAVPSIALCLLLSGVARAADEGKDAKTSKTPTEVTKAQKAPKTESREKEKTEKVVVTGSLIPRSVRRDGNITDMPFPVYVIDRKQIERSGAASVTQALRMTGFNR